MDVLGQLFAMLIFPVLADKYGRRKFTYLGIYLSIFAYLLMVMYPRIPTVYFGIFIAGIIFNNKNFISYTHLVEFMGKRASLVTGILFCYDSCVFIFSPIVALYLTKNTNVFLYIGILMSVLSGLLIHCFYFPESMKFNISKKKYESAFDDLRYILKVNGVNDEK